VASVYLKIWSADLIPVTPKPEPAAFDEAVRTPGTAFLQNNPATAKLPRFWRQIATQLHTSYAGICAYTAMYITPPGSVDHFLPTSLYRQLAYEWSNYRLASSQVNSYKGHSIDVIDPFLVRPGWFTIDFPSCLIRPAANLQAATMEQIQRSIDVLRLNSADHFVQERCDIVIEFIDGHLSPEFFGRRYPLLAIEVERQGGRDALRPVFKRPTKAN
jgi:hypothetical protein